MPDNRSRTWPRQRVVICLGVIAILAAFALTTPIQNQIQRYVVLHADGVNDDVVKALIARDHNPDAFMERLWRTRRIPQRQAVLEYLKSLPAVRTQSAEITALIEQAALDPDANARERALGLLQSRKSPRLLDFTRAQLHDADPQIRLLGLHYLRAEDNRRAVPFLMEALNDPDPAVAASADSTLRMWTGNDFGLRIRDTLTNPGLGSLAPIEPEKLALIHAAIGKWNSWWQTNQSNYAAATSISLPPLSHDRYPVASDFVLKNLDGHSVALSDFRGKTVLLTFWTTWCTACQEEMPLLIELQKHHPNDLAILAVSLDGVGVDDDDEIEFKGATNDNPLNATPRQIHDKIVRTIKARGINYIVLLDPHGSIGARFNGYELPTNVFIASTGTVCRRFIGARSLENLEAMLRDASASSSIARK